MKMSVLTIYYLFYALKNLAETHIQITLSHGILPVNE